MRWLTGRHPWQATETAASLVVAAKGEKKSHARGGIPPYMVFPHLPRLLGKLPASRLSRRISQVMAISPGNHQSHQFPWWLQQIAENAVQGGVGAAILPDGLFLN